MLLRQRGPMFLQESHPGLGATLPLVFSRKWGSQNSTPGQPNYSQTPFKTQTQSCSSSLSKPNMNCTVWVTQTDDCAKKKGDLGFYSLSVESTDVCNLTWILPNYWPIKVTHRLILWLKKLSSFCAKSCVYNVSKEEEMVWRASLPSVSHLTFPFIYWPWVTQY